MGKVEGKVQVIINTEKVAYVMYAEDGVDFSHLSSLSIEEGASLENYVQGLCSEVRFKVFGPVEESSRIEVNQPHEVVEEPMTVSKAQKSIAKILKNLELDTGQKVETIDFHSVDMTQVADIEPRIRRSVLIGMDSSQEIVWDV